MDNQQRLYFDDPFCFEFNARVLQVEQLGDGRRAAILERTYFYPTSGGQEHDTGKLGAARVVDVSKDEQRGVVLHMIEGDLSPGPLRATIDKERRLRHMQHHTAQHLLTQCFVRLAGLDTVSANINGYSPSTLDLAGYEPGKVQIDQVEELANQVIYEDRLVKAYFVSPEQVAALPLRKPPVVAEDIRIIEIDGYDYSACGGTHVTRTGMIGVVKVLRTERVKDKTRIHFIAGSQALETFRDYHDLLGRLAVQMSVAIADVGISVMRQAERLEMLQKEAGALRQEMLTLEARQLAHSGEAVASCRLVAAAFEGRSAFELRALAGELCKIEGVVALLAGYDAGKVAIIAACSPDSGQNAQAILKQQLGLLGGRGGGDARIAQGGAPASLEQFRAFTSAMPVRLVEGIRQTHPSTDRGVVGQG